MLTNVKLFRRTTIKHRPRVRVLNDGGQCYNRTMTQSTSSKLGLSGFAENQIALVPWPSMSSDFNPIENLGQELKKSKLTKCSKMLSGIEMCRHKETEKTEKLSLSPKP